MEVCEVSQVPPCLQVVVTKSASLHQLVAWTWPEEVRQLLGTAVVQSPVVHARRKHHLLVVPEFVVEGSK